MSENFVEKVEDIINLLHHNPNIILYGPPGTGKTYTAKAVALYLLETDKPFEKESLKSKLPELVNRINADKDWVKELDKYKYKDKDNKNSKDKNQGKDGGNSKNENQGRFSIVQFHSSYNYDDFVIGIEARTEKEQVAFEKVWRTLGEMSRRALVSMALPEKFGEYLGSNKENKDDKDEIYEEAKKMWLNANKDEREEMIKNAPPFVLIIDEINRANLPAVFGELIYALEYRGEPVKIMYGEELIIPPNLYIIGTMNTADRSAGRIDYAIRRRFTFYPMHAEIKEDMLKKGIIPDYGKNLMEAVNEFIENNISPEYDPEDIKIGHTYFMVKDKEKTDDEKRKEIAYKFLYQVVPLLYEYIKDGLVKAKREGRKGYLVELKIDLETGEEKKGNNEKKIYYLRGGRLYKDENNELRMKDLWFIKQQENKDEKKNKEDEKPKETKTSSHP